MFHHGHVEGLQMIIIHTIMSSLHMCVCVCVMSVYVVQLAGCYATGTISHKPAPGRRCGRRKCSPVAATGGEWKMKGCRLDVEKFGSCDHDQ